MSNESTKTNKVRSQYFFEKYLSGKVLDIGAGNDPVVADSEIFDIKDGNAELISNYLPFESYDSVHSSHCLEHMVDPKKALNEWWKILRNNGYLIITVPHEDLYEQKIWPPIFNPDHKNTFRINNKTSWSPVSFNILEIIKSLPGAKIIEYEVHDLNYDYRLQYRRINKISRRIHRKAHLSSGIKRIFLLLAHHITFNFFQVFLSMNKEVLDQTRGDALAQIQVVAQKAKD